MPAVAMGGGDVSDVFRKLFAFRFGPAVVRRWKTGIMNFVAPLMILVMTIDRFMGLSISRLTSLREPVPRRSHPQLTWSCGISAYRHGLPL